jgi:hypothetical protein
MHLVHTVFFSTAALLEGCQHLGGKHCFHLPYKQAVCFSQRWQKRDRLYGVIIRKISYCTFRRVPTLGRKILLPSALQASNVFLPTLAKTWQAIRCHNTEDFVLLLFACLLKYVGEKSNPFSANDLCRVHFLLSSFISLICDKGVTTQNLAFFIYWYRKKRLQMYF